jgi:hypothetical protein
MIIIAVVTVVVMILTALHLHHRHPLNGVLIVLSVSTIVGAYLPRSAGAVYWWGYPAKFAWLISSMLVVILTAALLSELASTRGRRWAARGSLRFLSSRRSPSWRRCHRHRTAWPPFTPVAIVTNTGCARPAAGCPAALRPCGASAWYSGRCPTQRLGMRFHQLVLQLESTSSSDPIRPLYVLDSRNEVQARDAVHAARPQA